VTVTVDRRQAQETGDETVEQGEDAESEDAEGASAPAGLPGGGRADRRRCRRRRAGDVGGGRVTWSGREDDRGAAWEIEVTRPDGSEVDVLIAADGSVVN
jgi:hypothetical protein